MLGTWCKYLQLLQLRQFAKSLRQAAYQIIIQLSRKTKQKKMKKYEIVYKLLLKHISNIVYTNIVSRPTVYLHLQRVPLSCTCPHVPKNILIG